MEVQIFILLVIQLYFVPTLPETTQKNPTKLISRNTDSQDASILGLITYIGGGLSLLGLFILLAVYSWFSELRNLPGKIVMSLSGALLIY